MKKYFVITACAVTALIFSYCSGSKKTTKTAAPPKVSYAANVSTVIAQNCSPCHIPAKGGNKKAYDNYANVKSDIDEILRRIELNPGQRGFMPMRGQKLSDSTIAVFKQFKNDGLREN